MSSIVCVEVKTYPNLKSMHLVYFLSFFLFISMNKLLGIKTSLKRCDLLGNIQKFGGLIKSVCYKSNSAAH